MKRGTWILVACGVFATALTIAIAQERGSSGDRSPVFFSGRAKPATDKLSKAESKKPVDDIGKKTKSTASVTVAEPHPLAGSSHLIHADHKRTDGQRANRVQHIGGMRQGDSPFPTKSGPAPRVSRAFDLKPPVPEIIHAVKTTSAKSQKIRPASFTANVNSAVRLSLAKIPSGPQSPTVTLKWTKTGELNVGQKCQCQLIVTNSGTVVANDVIVEASLPATVRVTKAVPAPDETNDTAIWKLGSLKPGETKTIALTLIPSRRGGLQAKASVRFTGLAASQFVVKEPMLKIVISGPLKALVGDTASQFITVSNPGTGVAKNVTIEAIIPVGLEHPRGSKLVMEIGSLSPGESRKVRLSLTAITGGSQKITVKATALATLTVRGERVVSIASPSLKVALSGPGLRYIGRKAVYTLTVTNDGSVATNNVRLLHKLPEGFQFLKADKGGSYDDSKRAIGWFVGRIEAGKSVEVKAILVAKKLGSYTHRAGAISEQGVRAETSIKTKIDGTASLVVELIDLDDPVEVGAETAYEIRVRNNGSKAASQVKIACELPKDVQLLNAKGPTKFTVKNGRLVFQALPTLAPGKTAVYRVHVKGIVAGNHRFRIRLTSDSITKPLTYDEQTKFYGEQ